MVNEESFRIAEKIKAQERKEQKERRERIIFTFIVLVIIGIICWGVISQLFTQAKKATPNNGVDHIVVENSLTVTD